MSLPTCRLILVDSKTSAIVANLPKLYYFGLFFICHNRSLFNLFRIESHKLGTEFEDRQMEKADFNFDRSLSREKSRSTEENSKKQSFLKILDNKHLLCECKEKRSKCYFPRYFLKIFKSYF